MSGGVFCWRSKSTHVINVILTRFELTIRASPPHRPTRNIVVFILFIVSMAHIIQFWVSVSWEIWGNTSILIAIVLKMRIVWGRGGCAIVNRDYTLRCLWTISWIWNTHRGRRGKNNVECRACLPPTGVQQQPFFVRCLVNRICQPILIPHMSHDRIFYPWLASSLV